MNSAVQAEELRFGLKKVGVRALITPLKHKKSHYYNTFLEVRQKPRETSGDAVDCDGEARPWSCQVRGVPRVRAPRTLRAEGHFQVLRREGRIPCRGAWKFEDLFHHGGGSDAQKALDQVATDILVDDSLNIQYTRVSGRGSGSGRVPRSTQRRQLSAT